MLKHQFIRAFSSKIKAAEPAVLSGIQPTGALHLGNYLGALQNWSNLQHCDVPQTPGSAPQEPKKFSKIVYMIADLHAITVPQDPARLRQNTMEMASALLACGIDPSRSIIFKQSDVYSHPYLSWILSCFTPMGWLSRMTQFKQKGGDDRDIASLGLFAYPVLQAADILIYKATHVPVGEDQRQHLELARDIATTFNHRYSTDVFPLPEAIYTKATRVMSLRDGRVKMSKSDPSDMTRVNLTDDEQLIRSKIKKAKTDSTIGVTYEPETRPELANLLNIYAELTGQTPESIAQQHVSSGSAQFKDALADVVVSKLTPINSEFRRISADKAFVKDVLKKGADSANEIAIRTLEEAKKITGFK